MGSPAGPEPQLAKAAIRPANPTSLGALMRTIRKKRNVAVSKRLRYEILRRDNHACRYCGATAPDAKLTVDHVTPTALGGTDAPENLVTACDPCNAGKSSMPADAAIVADVAQDAVRWSVAWKRAAEDVGLESTQKSKAAAKVKGRLSRLCKEVYGSTPKIPGDAQASIVRWLELGLPSEKINELAEYTVGRRNVPLDGKWRYFSGCCWNAIKDIEARTRAILGVTPAAPPAAEPLAMPTLEMDELDPVCRTALTVWVGSWTAELDEEPEPEQIDYIRSQLLAFQDSEDAETVEPDRLIRAVGRSVWLGDNLTIAEMLNALDQEDRCDAVIDWADTWTATTGVGAHTDDYVIVENQIKALVAGGTSLAKAVKAAMYAGAHGSRTLHFGLSEPALSRIGVRSARERAVEAWTGSFHATAHRWPTEDERRACLSHLDRVGEAGSHWLADVIAAAASAGTYQDPDITRCLPLHASALDAARQPLACSSN